MTSRTPPRVHLQLTHVFVHRRSRDIRCGGAPYFHLKSFLAIVLNIQAF